MDSIIAKREEKYQNEIKNLRLFDDVFMSKVFEDMECTKLVLEVILERDEVEIADFHGQHEIRNLQGRSIRMDMLIIDSEGIYTGIEVQRENGGGSPKRARYSSSLMDANYVNTGSKYRKIPEVNVIFIMEDDIFHRGEPIYHVERRIEETGEMFGDGSHIIYVNGSIQDETPLGRLMHDFGCTEADHMYYGVLARRVGYLKKSKEGVKEMSEVFERIREEGRLEGKQEGRKESLMEVIKCMLSNQFSLEDIALSTGLRVEDIQKYI